MSLCEIDAAVAVHVLYWLLLLVLCAGTQLPHRVVGTSNAQMACQGATEACVFNPMPCTLVLMPHRAHN